MPERDSVDTSQAPRVVVFTVKPRLLNGEELDRAMRREYPRDLREAGIGGTTVVHILVNEEGCVQDQLVKLSSSSTALDNAALRAVRVARFSPAMNRGERVTLWIELPMIFSAGRSRESALARFPRSDG